MQSCKACDALEHEIAGRMTVRVVDLLEMIDVDQQHQRGLAGPGNAVDLAGHRELELAPVGQPGERVAARQFAQRIDDRLQPGHAADLLAIRQYMARLLQQLHGWRQPQCGGGIGYGDVVHGRGLRVGRAEGK